MGILIALVNYVVFKPQISKARYCYILVFFSLWGWIQDAILYYTSTVTFQDNIFWLNSIWIIFIAYFGDVFSKFLNVKNWVLALTGGFAGVFAYWSGCNIADVKVNNVYQFISIIFVSWAIFFPVSLRLFESNKKASEL